MAAFRRAVCRGHSGREADGIRRDSSPCKPGSPCKPSSPCQHGSPCQLGSPRSLYAIRLACHTLSFLSHRMPIPVHYYKMD